MSVEESTIIDFVSLDQQDRVILTISDHLDWSAEQEHLMMLQEKINTYCRFLESGEIYCKYPEARDRKPTVRVVGFHEPTVRAFKFLAAAKAALENEGYTFEYNKYIESESA